MTFARLRLISHDVCYVCFCGKSPILHLIYALQAYSHFLVTTACRIGKPLLILCATHINSNCVPVCNRLNCLPCTVSIDARPPCSNAVNSWNRRRSLAYSLPILSIRLRQHRCGPQTHRYFYADRRNLPSHSISL